MNSWTTTKRVIPWMLAALAVGCGPREDAAAQAAADDAAQAAADDTAPAVTDAQALACTPQQTQNLATRPSPYDSVVVAVGGSQAKLCYGRPSARDRTIFGGLVPYGQLWRTGANEPTIIHLPVAATIAGLAVEPGSYSIYTVPGENEWTVIVNRSISQWGHESRYTAEVQEQEVGRATVTAETLPEHVEQFTITAPPAGNGSDLVLDWERTRVRIPVRPAGA